MRATGGRVAEGSVGAGTGATVASLLGRDRALKGGLGSASERLESGATVGAIVAVNSSGAIRDPSDGSLVAGPRADGSGFVDLDAHLRSGVRWHELPDPDAIDGEDGPENTTIAVVATDARLTREQANRLASVCHDGFARTIWPAHCRSDGDVIFRHRHRRGSRSTATPTPPSRRSRRARWSVRCSTACMQPMAFTAFHRPPSGRGRGPEGTLQTPVTTPPIGAWSGLRGGPWSGDDDRGCKGAYTVRRVRARGPCVLVCIPPGFGTE